MSFEKYLRTISLINPQKIYVENIRAMMNVSTKKARLFCEMAVKESVFVRRIGVVCPNDQRIIAEYNDESELPDEITCKVCEIGEIDPSTFKTAELQKIIFYKLKK